MLSARAYLANLAAFLERRLGPFAAPPRLVTNATDESGQLRGVICFPDGCELHVNLLVDPNIEPLLPLARYRFHLQDRTGRCVVRFDNKWHSSHQHRQLATFPHHLHEGPSEQVQPHPYPSARQIVRRVLSYHDGHQGLP